MALPSEWFCALLESAPDVYFRFSLTPPRGFAYVSPSVRALTGRAPADFYADRNLCLSLVVAEDRRLLRSLLRARRGATVTIRLRPFAPSPPGTLAPSHRGPLAPDVAVPVEVRTVSVVRQGRLVAIEGVARLAAGSLAQSSSSSGQPGEPVQQRLAALMFEVHDLLHRVLPPAARASADSSAILRLGDLELDTARLTVTESGRLVSLTPREVLVLRYLLDRPGRIVTRSQLLTDVWSYQYTGDDRTVDVHISRLRRKLPSLEGRLVAIRNIGYRLDEDDRESGNLATCDRAK